MADATFDAVREGEDRELDARPQLGRGIDLSIGQRLAIGFGFLLLLLVVQLGVFLYQGQQIMALQHNLETVILPRARAASRVENAYLQQAVAVRNYLISNSASDLDAYRSATERSDAAVADLETLPADPDGQPLVAEIRGLGQSYTRATDRLVELKQQGADLTSLAAAETEIAPLRLDTMNVIRRYVELQQEKQQQTLLAVAEAQSRATTLVFVISALMLAIGAVTAALTANAVQGPVRNLLVAARALAHGQYGPALALRRAPRPGGLLGEERPPRDELVELAESFGYTAQQLWAREKRLAARNRVSAALASSIEVERLAADVLREVAAYAGCEYASLYLLDDASRLVRAAGYAADGQAATFNLGEGIPGQAAASRETVVVRDIPADAPFHIRLGVDDLPPRAVAAVPVVLYEQLLGVIVLASVRDISEDALEFAERTAEQLGVSLRIAFSHQEIARLTTELQARNEELASQNEELQAQAEEIQAQNEQLQLQTEMLSAYADELEDQRKALLESDRAKDEFLSVASHELRGPITSLKGFTQLLLWQARKDPALEKYVGHLTTIDQQADVLVSRIKRLLDASRARMGRLELQPGPVDLVPLVREQIEQAQVRTQKHQIVLKADETELLGTWDRATLGQVVSNLLDNAIRYSPDGGEVEVVLRREGDEARLSVTDHGIGIRPEAMEKLFKSYFRDEAAARVTGEGLGIGLYFSHQVVVAHGGRMWVESEVGNGSTFHVALPLASGPAVAVGGERAD